MYENSYFQFTKNRQTRIWFLNTSVHTSASKCDKSEHYSMRARTSFYGKKYRQGNYISHTLLYVSFPYKSFFVFVSVSVSWITRSFSFDIFNPSFHNYSFMVCIAVWLSSFGLSPIPMQAHFMANASRYLGWLTAKTTGFRQDAILAKNDGNWETKGDTRVRSPKQQIMQTIA